jgi:hypothetical protein
VSAWIVSRAHIDVLVQGLAESEHVTDLDPDDVGRALWRENLASVAYRYPDDTGDGDRPGYLQRDEEVEEYIYRRPARKIDPSGLLYAIGCYDYQSCEHPGWVTSDAYRWVSTLADALRQSPGINESPKFGTYPWGYDEEDVHEVVTA